MKNQRTGERDKWRLSYAPIAKDMVFKNQMLSQEVPAAPVQAVDGLRNLSWTNGNRRTARIPIPSAPPLQSLYSNEPLQAPHQRLTGTVR